MLRSKDERHRVADLHQREFELEDRAGRMRAMLEDHLGLLQVLLRQAQALLGETCRAICSLTPAMEEAMR